MRSIGLVVFLIAGSASAATWTPTAAPARAYVNGGPWVLAQGAAAFPSPNPSTNLFQPYYQGHTTGTDSTIQGYFDYRPKGLAESIVAARSTDGGKSWSFQSQVLVESGDDAGEGHPFLLTVGGQTLLYTLDRDTSAVDSLGLFARVIAPTSADPLAGAPATATPGSGSAPRTVGLATPDGIIAVVPGTSLTVLYLAKDVSVTPNVVSVHLADTTDGVHFSNDRVVSGLVSASLPFIGPRGTLTQYADGHFGLFFSAGLVGEDADAFHFIGYAESSDLTTWSVVNDVDHPLLSTDAAKDPTGGQPWYAGRLYAPSVTFSADGCSATMVFAGYKTVKPTDSPNDYRQIGVVTLQQSCASATTGGSTTTSGTTTGGSTTTGSTTSGSTTGGSTSGGSTTGSGATGSGTTGSGTTGSGTTGSGATGSTTNSRTSSGGCALGGTASGAPALGLLLLLVAASRRRRQVVGAVRSLRFFK